jgi:hypothetical protein
MYELEAVSIEDVFNKALGLSSYRVMKNSATPYGTPINFFPAPDLLRTNARAMKIPMKTAR